MLSLVFHFAGEEQLGGGGPVHEGVHFAAHSLSWACFPINSLGVWGGTVSTCLIERLGLMNSSSLWGWDNFSHNNGLIWRLYLDRPKGKLRFMNMLAGSLSLSGSRLLHTIFKMLNTTSSFKGYLNFVIRVCSWSTAPVLASLLQ